MRTTAEHDAPSSLRRRRLLLGLPGALGLPFPLALLGCGGGGGGGEVEAVAAPARSGGLSEPGRAYAGTLAFTETAVEIELPAGMVVPDGGLAALSLLGGFSPVSGTRASVRHLPGSPQWTSVVSAEGWPLLFGYVGGGMNRLSAHSTAVALLAAAMGAEFAGGSANAAWIQELRDSPAASGCASAIGAALAADPYALATGSPAVMNALVAAIRQLLPALPSPASSRARPLGVSVNPPDAASGVQPIIGDALNTVFLRNEKLRRAFYVIRREGHTPSTGAEIADAARPLISADDVPMLPGFESAGSIIGSVTQAHYGQDSTGLAASSTPVVALAVTPDGAKRTRYSVTVLTAGNAALGYDPALYARLTDDEKKKIDITLFAPENLALRQLFIDMLVPLFLTWLGGKVGDEASSRGPREFKERIEAALFANILSTFQTTLPTIAAKLRDPKGNPAYGIGGALQEIVRSQLVDFVDLPIPGRAQPLTVPTLSRFSISMLLLLLKYLAYEKMSVANGEALLKFLEGDANPLGETLYEWQPGKDGNGNARTPLRLDKENLAFAGIGVAAKCLSLVDNALNLLSKTRLLADMASSRLLEGWDLNVVQAKVRLRPDPFEVDASGVYALTAEIVDNDDDAYGNEKGSFSFDWVCTALAGDLYKRGSSETNRFTTSNANATVDYVPRGAEPSAGVEETISVAAYFEPIGHTRPRELVGRFSLPVKFRKAFNLAIVPATGEVPADSTIGLTASIKEYVPPNTTVDWEWSHAGAGALRAGTVDGNVRDSTALLDTGSGEGEAVVSVRARVTLPAEPGKELRSVLTDPVRATLKVRKGLRTLTLAGGWAIDTMIPAPGFTQASAYVVVPKVSGAKGYSVLLEKPTPDVPRGVPFPSTRTINPAAPSGWEDRGGAYWSGLSGGGGADPWAATNVIPWLVSRFSDMTVTVTVTL